MADITQISDSDLLAALGQQQPQQPPTGVTQGVTAPIRIQMGNPGQTDNPLASMSDADLLNALGQQPSSQNLPSPQPQSFTDKLAALWQNPPPGPSLIGAAKSLYDAVLTPGRTIQAAEDQAKKTQITDSDIPLSSSVLAGPAMNMAQNIVLPAPGVSLQALPKLGAAAETAPSAVQQKAAQIVSAPLKDRGINTAQAAQQALSAIGPEAVLADVDPRLTQMAGTVAAKPGPGQQILRDALDARNAAAANRIVSTTDQVMGAPIDLSKAGDEIYNSAKTAAAPLYAQAYQAPIQSTPELQQTLATPAGQLAIKRARTLALNNPEGPQSAMFNAPPSVDLSKTFSPETLANMPDKMRASLQAAGVLNPAQPVDVRGLHLIRQAFDDIIKRASNPVTSAGNNFLSGLQKNRAVVDSVLKQVQPMAQADQIFASQSAIRDAMGQGLNVFKNSQTPEEVAGLLAGMSDAEKTAYQQGARVAVRNVMGTARNDAAAARGLFAKEFNQEKLASVLGQDEANQILNRIGAETAYANTDQRVLRNSETAARAYGKDALENAHGFPDALSTLNYSGLHSIPRHIALKGVNKVLTAAKAGRQQAVETEVAKLLSLGHSDRVQALSALYQEGLRRDPSGKLNLAITPFVLQHAAAPDLAQSQ